MRSDYHKLLEEAIRDSKALAVWREPEGTLRAIGPKKPETWNPGQSGNEGFVFAPFDTDIHPIWFLSEEEGRSVSFTSVVSFPKLSDKATYMKLVNREIQAIQSGKFSKLVAARAMETEPIGDAMTHFEQLCERYENAFCYLWYAPSTGIWLGASPELLLRKEGNTAETVALAGTQVSDTDFGEKELQEQEFVLDYLRETLDPVCRDLLVSEKNRVKSGHLTHLFNRVEMNLEEGMDVMKLALMLHPTPAVAGLPKQEAIRWIDREEGFDRSYYAGFIGPSYKDKTAFYVNLRCMQIVRERYFVYVGAGITSLSDPAREWVETEEKSKVIRLKGG